MSFRRKSRLGKYCLTILTVIFFGGMLFLTVKARTIHNRMIPNVKMRRLERWKTGVILPKELYDSGNIYIVVEEEKNGETRNFVEEAAVTVGEQISSGYVVLDGIGEWDFVVTESDKELRDGMEVFIAE